MTAVRTVRREMVVIAMSHGCGAYLNKERNVCGVIAKSSLFTCIQQQTTAAVRQDTVAFDRQTLRAWRMFQNVYMLYVSDV